MTKPVLKDVLGMVGANGPKMETARMENTQLGVCPCCQQEMQIAEAAGITCYVCEADCVCLPTAN